MATKVLARTRVRSVVRRRLVTQGRALRAVPRTKTRMLRVPATVPIPVAVLQVTTALPTLAVPASGTVLDGHVAAVAYAILPAVLKARPAPAGAFLTARASEGVPLVRAPPKKGAPTPRETMRGVQTTRALAGVARPGRPSSEVATVIRTTRPLAAPLGPRRQGPLAVVTLPTMSSAEDGKFPSLDFGTRFCYG